MGALWHSISLYKAPPTSPWSVRHNGRVGVCVQGVGVYIVARTTYDAKPLVSHNEVTAIYDLEPRVLAALLRYSSPLLRFDRHPVAPGKSSARGRPFFNTILSKWAKATAEPVTAVVA